MTDETKTNGAERPNAHGKGQRRYKHVCYTCRTPFEPRAGGGQLICPGCVIDSLRGDRRFRPRF